MLHCHKGCKVTFIIILQLQFLQSVKMPNQHQFCLLLSLNLMFVGLFVFLYLCVSAFLEFYFSLFFCHPGMVDITDLL